MQLTRITHLQSNQALASTNELEGSQAHSSMVTKSLEVLNLSQDRASLLFIGHIFYPIELKFFVVCPCVLLAEEKISKEQKQKKSLYQKRKEKK